MEYINNATFLCYIFYFWHFIFPLWPHSFGVIYYPQRKFRKEYNYGMLIKSCFFMKIFNTEVQLKGHNNEIRNEYVIGLREKNSRKFC